MAVTLEELQVMITANTKELTNELKNVQSRLKNLEKSTASIGTEFLNAAKKVAKVTAAVGGTALAVKKLVDQTKEYIQAQAVQTEAETKLETIMKQRMSATNDMVQAVKNFTAAQQEIGIVGDEVQMAGAQ